MNFQSQTYEFFDEQLLQWKLARDNFAEMNNLKTKIFNFEQFNVEICCNPIRISSTAINIIKAEYPENSCFLCVENHPNNQIDVDLDEFVLLVNPYPIFPIHFTIAHKKHIRQEILPYFSNYLRFAKLLPDFVIFFNGAKCGASAPHHAHFQAAEQKYFPLLNDFNHSKNIFVELEKNNNYTIFESRNYLRKVVVIQAQSNVTELFQNLLARFITKGITSDMINVLCTYSNGTWTIFTFPRKNFRPTQFFEQNEAKHLRVSPGTVEMSGKFITPLMHHFQKITKTDVVDIYKQISF
jgi:hypothetical protein